MIESLDGGKPIRESRDIDIPLAAAHFFYYAGWADKLEYRIPGQARQTPGCGGPDYSLEFPVADGSLEDRAGTRLRKHGGAEAC